MWNIVRNPMHLNFSAFSSFSLSPSFTRHTPSIKADATSSQSPFHLNNMSRITAFPVALLLFLLSSVFSSVEGCPQHELNALFTFKATVNDTLEIFQSWKGENCCAWHGVECDGPEADRHVSKLDLEDQLDSGSVEIGSSLSELKHLNHLGLSGENFHGEIPSHLGNLSSLRYLHISSGICTYSETFPYHYYCDGSLTSCNLDWLSNLSMLEYLSFSGVNVSDKSWGNTIGTLFHLKHLELSWSSWSSVPAPTIPAALLNLTSLTYLDLRGMSLSNIPTWMGELSSLTHLDLSYNRISGSIPNAIGNLTALEHLDLSDNALTGSLPLAFAHLSSLIELDVSFNQLNGSIPSALKLPSALQELDLSSNIMKGTVTEDFFQRSFKLNILYMSHSGLSINISSTWIPTFQLGQLELNKCQIGGPIPSWISTQFSLWYLGLSATQLIGDLPSWLWDIDGVDLSNNHLQGSFTPTSGSLRYLYLPMNELSGRLPADIDVHLPNAVELVLADNKFEGQVPASVANLRNLSFLDISNNRLTGNVPAAFANLKNLAFLDISNNRLTGNVPATLANLTLIQALNLENNYLEGEIPRELGRLSYLQSLRIGKNRLQGVLPSSLRNLSRLQVLDVGASSFAGNIPNWIANFSSLQVLVMRFNNLRGKLPSEIGQMPKLQVLDLSSNFFSGKIPHSYLRLPALQNSSADRGLFISNNIAGDKSIDLDLNVKGREMHYAVVPIDLASLDLSNNRLSGSLPSEIDNLKALIFLNLSRNSLSGPIPESLGNLVQLESVDLSFNNFTGQIPSQLGNLTFLAHLDLSFNNLRGRIPHEHAQMITFDASSYIGNPNLWGCPLERNCSHPGMSPPPAVGVEKKREEGFEFPWYWMCFGLAVGVGFSGVVVVLVFNIRWSLKYFEVMDRVVETIDRVIFLPLKSKPKPMRGGGPSTPCIELV